MWLDNSLSTKTVIWSLNVSFRRLYFSFTKSTAINMDGYRQMCDQPYWHYKLNDYGIDYRDRKLDLLTWLLYHPTASLQDIIFLGLHFPVQKKKTQKAKIERDFTKKIGSFKLRAGKKKKRKEKCETAKEWWSKTDRELVQGEIKGQERGKEREARSSVRSTVVHFARRQLQPQLTNPEGPLVL